MPISSISRLANMGLQNLHCASVPVGLRALRALGKAHPGVNPEKLLATCNQLFGEPRNYTFIGSTSLHLQALRFLKPEQTLPLPNDLDVTVNSTGMRQFNNIGKRVMEDLQLTSDPCGIVFMPRERGDTLKIDVTSDHEFGFAKYTQCPNSIEGMNVAQITHTYDEDLLRLIDPLYIELCGGLDNTKRLFNERWQHFDQTQLRMLSMTLCPPIQAILNFSLKPVSDVVVINHSTGRNQVK
ncbi:hypothetical protein [Limnobacter parvus]|uniref:Nucleotidyl transferase AbiEii/AbiGii toxin family protein n=1 Tax=Limnobacter parvus TaxID=2939690 RepID=A0ABT1XE11_9BURK|nr:hypothetical protein [Limnobacter parvus]MCR2745513.1 hypothetical protein [Limnobacter parvus]